MLYMYARVRTHQCSNNAAHILFGRAPGSPPPGLGRGRTDSYTN
jgi:hypothetical protein